jgi:hypothetical protein
MRTPWGLRPNTIQPVVRPTLGVSNRENADLFIADGKHHRVGKATQEGPTNFERGIATGESGKRGRSAVKQRENGIDLFQ